MACLKGSLQNKSKCVLLGYNVLEVDRLVVEGGSLLQRINPSCSGYQLSSIQSSTKKWDSVNSFLSGAGSFLPFFIPSLYSMRVYFIHFLMEEEQ